MIVTAAAAAACAASTPYTGFSLSPGGLLYPYHIGVLSSLEYHQQLLPSTPLAGASAGAIAVASYCANVKPETCLDTTIKICSECTSRGGARGRLLPLLEAELEALLEPNAHEIVNAREGLVGIAYYELFPQNRPILQTHFDSRQDLTEAVLHSSMFPFFSTNWPVRIAKSTTNHQNHRQKQQSKESSFFSSLPRIVVDGYFAVPFDRFGCPDFDMPQQGKEESIDTKDILLLEDQLEDQIANELVSQSETLEEEKTPIERTVTVSVFPHESVFMTASKEHDRISPIFDRDDPIGQVNELLRLATQPITAKEVHNLYERGWEDAERWMKEEGQRKKETGETLRTQDRKSWLGWLRNPFA